jgi:hypothetical protein
VATGVSLVVLLVLAIAFLAHAGPAHRAGARPQRSLDGARYELATLPQPAPLRFVPGTPAGDQRAVLDAIASARPEARRVIERVAGLVTVEVLPLSPDIAGGTRATREGYDVGLDLGRVSRQYGARGIARVTLHELGHVVDGALVPADMEKALDAAIPRGWGCDDGGKAGACADRAERFAESFAKWATGDIGVDIYLGYRVPPPVPLETWGAPIAALAP